MKWKNKNSFEILNCVRPRILDSYSYIQLDYSSIRYYTSVYNAIWLIGRNACCSIIIFCIFFSLLLYYCCIWFVIVVCMCADISRPIWVKLCENGISITDEWIFRFQFVVSYFFLLATNRCVSHTHSKKEV